MYSTINELDRQTDMPSSIIMFIFMFMLMFITITPVISSQETTIGFQSFGER